MKKAVVAVAMAIAILAVADIAVSAPNFVDDNTSLPGPKTDRSTPLNPSQQWTASDANTVIGALRDLRTVLQRGEINAKAFGATGNGTTDDATALQAAMNAAAATSSIAYGAIVYMPRGTYAIGSQLSIPNGVGLRGDGPASTILRARSSFNAASLIRNAAQDGTQEFAFLQSLQLDCNQVGGAVCSAAVVDFVSVFVNSYIRDVLITGGANVGLHVAAANAAGPVLIENTWVVNNTGHNVLLEELAGNTQAVNGITAVNLTSEHQGTGKSALYLKGLGHAAQWNFYNTHIEQGGSATARTGITIDGVSHVLFDGVQLLTSGGVDAGITITNAIQNVSIQIRNVTNANLINPVLQDQKNGVSIGPVNLPWYVTPDVTIRGGLRYTPDIASTAKSLVAQDSSGTDRAWFDKDGAVTGSSLNGGAGLDVVGDSTNDRPLALINHSKNRVFAWYYPDASNLRFRYFTGGLDLLNFDSSAAMFVYGTSTFQFLSTFQSGIRGAGSRAAPPSSGAHVQGEIVFNADPIAGGFLGWVCVSGGTPGTWKSWGAISP